MADHLGEGAGATRTGPWWSDRASRGPIARCRRRPLSDQDRPRPSHGPILVAQLASLSRAAAGLFGTAKIFAVISSFTGSNCWRLGLRGRLPAFLCPPECVGKPGFAALDHDYGTQLLNQRTRQLEVIQRRYDRAPISATGLYDALHDFADMFPEDPLFVIENGFIGHPRGWRRARQLRAHPKQVQRAAADGLTVVGYLAWSLTTNREWGLPATPASDFGLYHVDLDHDPALKRHRTPLGQMYERIVRRRRA
ncbi:MAG: family 1 glycosylhydrolase [Chloroflexi bacterium]|nr:family 1 glycosylhydrolase [Chloroflexota bacterium]